MNAILTTNNLSYRYKGADNEALHSINLHMKQGEILGIMGPSGGGKSTLCYAIKGIVPHMIGGHLSGSVSIKGRDIVDMSQEDRVRTIGMVFQDPMTQLFSSTVEDELAFSLENLCVPPDKIIKQIHKILNQLGLESYRKVHPGRLSGGLQQLVALGAVLVLEPELLILDEALAQLDKKSRENIKEVLAHLRLQGTSILMVEHELENLSIADQIMYLEDGALYKKEMGHGIYSSR